MSRLSLRALGLLALLFLVGCQTTALESQTKPLAAHQARLYILRDSTYVYAGGMPDIFVDGQKVGTIGNGSYFFVDRPPGRHTVTLETPLTPGRYTATMTLRPGNNYVKIAPRGEHMAIGMMGGMVGLLIDAAVSENSGAYTLTAVDPKEGAAMLAAMRG